MWRINSLNFSLETEKAELWGTFSALEVFLNDMRYINPRFTYLLTYDIAPVLLSSSVDLVLQKRSRLRYSTACLSLHR